MQTFRKIVVIPEQYGNRDFAHATKIVEVPCLDPRAGEIVVKVMHTGIEASDIVQMAGGYGPLAGKQPATAWDGSVQVGDLGCEGVGVITAVGDGVENFVVGDAVAFQGFGVSFRESVLLNVAGAKSGRTPSAFKIPVPTPEWTAVPVSALTATGGLEIAGNVRPGQNVLITGAAGGTGHIAVQWAKIRGCRVAGTCGDENKVAMLKQLGCDVVVNYRSDNVASVLAQEFPSGFDLVYDGVGGRIGNMARRLLADGGFLVQIGSVGTDYSGTRRDDVDGAPIQLKQGQCEAFFFVGNWKGFGKTAADWDKLVANTIDAVAAGEIKIQMDNACRSFVGLEGVYRAQARMREGKNLGKIFATIGPAQESRQAQNDNSSFSAECHQEAVIDKQKEMH